MKIYYFPNMTSLLSVSLLNQKIWKTKRLFLGISKDSCITYLSISLFLCLYQLILSHCILQEITTNHRKDDKAICESGRNWVKRNVELLCNCKYYIILLCHIFETDIIRDVLFNIRVFRFSKSFA